jgi:LuxR family maltose regulon positive regulatory protein
LNEDLERALFEAKTRIPAPRPNVVTRAPLIERVRSSGFRTVGITAPAGYGKSTLLAEWARAEDRPVAWMSLDRFDNEPTRMLTLLAHAYGQLYPDGAREIADLVSPGSSPLGRAAPLVAAALASSPAPFVLMLDDLHEIELAECHDVLGLIVDAIPQGSQFVTASRFEQPHLPYARASGNAIEVVATDLALDVTEAQRVFASQDVTLSAELAENVIQQTEGWPVGLYLAALIAREGSGDAADLSGADTYVADYLYQETLEAQPESIRQFLRRTAVLEQMCGALCDAVIGVDGSAERLRALEASGLFTIPLDRRREWYRYHALFREFLLSELQRREPGLRDELHVRAADWYEANGLGGRAVEHLLATQEHARAARAVARETLATYQAGGMRTGLRWLATLGDRAIERVPTLAALAGWGGVLSGDATTAERWGAFVDAIASPPADDPLSFASFRAALRAVMCAHGPEAMLEDASFAVAHLPAGSPVRNTALWTLAQAHLVNGDVEEARALHAEASSVANNLGYAAGFANAESELAMSAFDRGQWMEGAEHVTSARVMVDKYRLHDFALCTLSFVSTARLALHRGELDEVDAELTRAMRARPTTTFVLPSVAVRLRVWLAKLYLALGDPGAARQLVHELDDILRHRPMLGALVDQIDDIKHDLASSDPATIGTAPLSPAELRLLPYLQTHLTLAAIAERLFVSRNTVSSQVTSIYRKLGVVSRSEAVERATSVGLVG